MKDIISAALWIIAVIMVLMYVFTEVGFYNYRKSTAESIPIELSPIDIDTSYRVDEITIPPNQVEGISIPPNQVEKVDMDSVAKEFQEYYRTRP